MRNLPTKLFNIPLRSCIIFTPGPAAENASDRLQEAPNTTADWLQQAAQASYQL